MRHLIAIAALGAALVPCVSRAAEAPPIHVGSIYVTKVGNGPTPLVLIPGLGCGPWVWENFVHSLPERQYTVYKITLAGFDGTPAVAGPARLASYTSSIQQMIENQHIVRPVIVGHSLGGALALNVAAGTSVARGLIIVDSLPLFPPLGPGETIAARKSQWAAIAAKIKSQDDSAFAADEHRVIKQMVTDPGTADDVATRVLRSDRTTLAEVVAELATTDLHSDVPRLSAPALVLAPGDNGFAADATQQFYQQQYAGAQNVTVKVIPKSRHFIMLDQPAAFHDAVLDFIEGLK